MSLNYTNSVPLHIQLKQIIHRNISEGIYTDKIPSERELMKIYYVSRSTVRQAVEQLVIDDILEKRPGKGTFIKVKPISSWLGNLYTTNETIQQMGMMATVSLSMAKQIELNKQLQQITGLEEAFFFERIRYANEIPIGIERSYYPIEIGRKLQQFNLNKESFYDLLENEIGIKALRSNQQITAGEFTLNDANLLNIPKQSIYIGVERMITDLNEHFVEYESALYRSDMYSFTIQSGRNINVD